MKKTIESMTTDRLMLRPVVDSDIENIFKGLSDPLVVRHYGVSFDTLEATKEQMIWYGDMKQYWWAIFSSDNSEFYGAGGLNDISEEHKKAEVGLWLLPDYWGKGIMKETMPLICDYGFNKLGLHRIEGFVESHNMNCKRALAKLDFVYEGTMQDCEVKDGKYVSVDIYARLNH